MVCLLCIAAWIVVFSIIAHFFQKKYGRQNKIRKHNWKPDIVYLYQFPRSKTIPNVSTFCLKVESFLRVNKIPYEICPLLIGRSKYGLLPFIELNGEHIADSQIIISRLKEHFKVKPLPSSKNEAIARTIERTAENHTVLLMRQFKVIEDSNNGFVKMFLQEFGFPSALLPALTPLVAYMMKRKVCKRISATIGQLCSEEFKQLLQMDLDTYRDLLDDRFLFGDEISSADCSVFSVLAAILYIPPNNYAKELLQERYPQLVAYCNRFRDTVFGKDFIEE